jgi:hypothetical protein
MLDDLKKELRREDLYNKRTAQVENRTSRKRLQEYLVADDPQPMIK